MYNEWWNKLTNRENIFKVPETQFLSSEQKRLAFESWLREHSTMKHFELTHVACQSCPYREM